MMGFGLERGHTFWMPRPMMTAARKGESSGAGRAGSVSAKGTVTLSSPSERSQSGATWRERRGRRKAGEGAGAYDGCGRAWTV